jgi:hypothetical protein
VGALLYREYQYSKDVKYSIYSLQRQDESVLKYWIEADELKQEKLALLTWLSASEYLKKLPEVSPVLGHAVDYLIDKKVLFSNGTTVAPYNKLMEDAMKRVFSSTQKMNSQSPRKLL